MSQTLKQKYWKTSKPVLNNLMKSNSLQYKIIIEKL